MKEARTPTLVDAFERGAESKPATPRPPAATNGKPAADGSHAAPRAASSSSTSPAAREPSARMRCWCSEE